MIQRLTDFLILKCPTMLTMSPDVEIDSTLDANSEADADSDVETDSEVDTDSGG